MNIGPRFIGREGERKAGQTPCSMRKKCCASSPASQMHFYKRNVDFTEKIRTSNSPTSPCSNKNSYPNTARILASKQRGKSVGVGRFELPTSSSRTTHANRAALHPATNSFLKNPPFNRGAKVVLFSQSCASPRNLSCCAAPAPLQCSSLNNPCILG